MAELEPQFLEVVSTDARELRTAFMGKQAGVWDAGDLAVGPGTGLAIEVAAGVGFVQGTSVTDQGLYRIRNDATKSSAAFSGGGIPANNSGQPRIDQVIARVRDHTHDSSGLRDWTLFVAVGVGTSGATLDNRSGAISNAALGNNWLRLADVLVPAGATSILSANIRDRRLRARGAHAFTQRTGSTAAVALTYGGAGIGARIECSGVPLIATCQVPIQTTTSGTYSQRLYMNGVYVAGTTTSRSVTGTFAATAQDKHVIVPTAGRHLFEFFCIADNGGFTLITDADRIPGAHYAEEIRPVAVTT